MLPHWKHPALEQRVEIAHGLAHGEPLKSIAERIGLPMIVEIQEERAPELSLNYRAVISSVTLL